MTAYFGWQNLVKSSTLTAGSSATSLGPSNVQNDQGAAATAWQTNAGVLTPIAGAWLLMDAAFPTSVWRGFGLFRTNLTEASSVRWRVGNSISGSQVSSPYAYDSGLIPTKLISGFGQTVLILPSDVLGRYCQVDINDPSNPDVFINVPLVYVGALFNPERGVSFQSTIGRDSQTDEVVSRGGQEFPTLRWQRRRWEVKMDALTADEAWDQVARMDVSSRVGGNILFLPDHASNALQQEAIFGRIKTSSDISYPYRGADARAWSAQITERL